MVKLLDYLPDEKYDAVMALGSINFGSTDKIFAELEHAVNLCNPGAVLFFRANLTSHELMNPIGLVFILGCQLYCELCRPTKCGHTRFKDR